MVRKAIVKDLCDVCITHPTYDIERDADYCMVIRLNNGPQLLEIDLCEEHVDTLTVKEMIDATREGEDNDSSKGNTDRPKTKCAFCGKKYSVGSGMALHFKSKHPEQYKQESA
jgi:hypothetical protein